MNKLLTVRNLKKYYTDQNNNEIKAVDDVSFSVEQGSVYALIGPSGSGKTTLAKAVLKLIMPNSGQIFFEDIDILSLKEKELRALRPKMQIIFQNPYASLSPRRRVEQIIKEGMIENKIVPKQEMEPFFANMIKDCEIDASLLDRFPNQLSGGERQRVAIARALMLKPSLVVADEIISSLDREAAKQILDLIVRLKREKNISFLYISHDISSVKYIADFIGVMQDGKIIEQGVKDEIISNPQNEFTKYLLKNSELE